MEHERGKKERKKDICCLELVSSNQRAKLDSSERLSASRNQLLFSDLRRPSPKTDFPRETSMRQSAFKRKMLLDVRDTSNQGFRSPRIFIATLGRRDDEHPYSYLCLAVPSISSLKLIRLRELH